MADKSLEIVRKYLATRLDVKEEGFLYEKLFAWGPPGTSPYVLVRVELMTTSGRKRFYAFQTTVDFDYPIGVFVERAVDLLEHADRAVDLAIEMQDLVDRLFTAGIITKRRWTLDEVSE